MNKTNTSKKISKKIKQPKPILFKQTTKPMTIPAAVNYNKRPMLKASVELMNREYVTTLTGSSSTFAMLGSSAMFPGYDLNPSNSQLFPWLSQIATGYEKYRFESIGFELIPRNSTASQGTVYMAFDYDWDDTPATTSSELMVNHGSVSANVWAPVVMFIDTNRLNMDVPYRYVADVPRQTNSQRMVYGGFLMVAIAGAPLTVTFDLFVQYRVKFDLPALHSTTSTATSTLSTPATYPAATPLPLPVLPTVPGIANVITGLSGVPNMGFPNSPAIAVPQSHKGTYALTVLAATAATAPDAWATDTKLLANLFDSNGTYLTQIATNEAENGSQLWQSPNVATDWTTNGAPGKMVLNLGLLALRKAFPTVAYILPLLVSSSGRILSTVSSVNAKYSEL